MTSTELWLFARLGLIGAGVFSATNLSLDDCFQFNVKAQDRSAVSGAGEAGGEEGSLAAAESGGAELAGDCNTVQVGLGAVSGDTGP
jgi:hypothetical protein